MTSINPTDPKPTPALLACPSAERNFNHDVFLTSRQQFPDREDWIIYWVECNCGVRGPERITEAEAIKAWGYIRRPPLPVEGAPNPPRCPDCLNFHWKESPRTCGVEAPAAGEGDTPEVDSNAFDLNDCVAHGIHTVVDVSVARSLERRLRASEALVEEKKELAFGYLDRIGELEGRLSALLNGKGEPKGWLCVHPEHGGDFKHGSVHPFPGNPYWEPLYGRLSEENKGADYELRKIILETVHGNIPGVVAGKELEKVNGSFVSLFREAMRIARVSAEENKGEPREWDADTIKDAPEERR